MATVFNPKLEDDLTKNLQSVSTISIVNTFRELHQKALDEFNRKFPEYTILNTSFEGDGKNIKFLGAGENIILFTAKKEELLDAEDFKDKAFEGIKTYIQWYAGPDIAEKITEKDITPYTRQLTDDELAKKQKNNDSSEDEESSENTNESLFVKNFINILFEATQTEDLDDADLQNEKIIGYKLTYRTEIGKEQGSTLQNSIKRLGDLVFDELKSFGIEITRGNVKSSITVGDVADALQKKYINPTNFVSTVSTDIKKEYPQLESTVDYLDAKSAVSYLKDKLNKNDKTILNSGAKYVVGIKINTKGKSAEFINKRKLADILTNALKQHFKELGILDKLKNAAWAIQPKNIVLIDNYASDAESGNNDRFETDKKTDTVENQNEALITKELLNLILENIEIEIVEEDTQKTKNNNILVESAQPKDQIKIRIEFRNIDPNNPDNVKSQTNIVKPIELTLDQLDKIKYPKPPEHKKFEFKDWNIPLEQLKTTINSDYNEYKNNIATTIKRLTTKIKSGINNEFKQSVVTGIYYYDEFKEAIGDEPRYGIALDAIKEPLIVAAKIDYFDDDASNIVNEDYKVNPLKGTEKNSGLNKITTYFEECFKDIIGENNLGKKIYKYRKRWDGENLDGKPDTIFVFAGYKKYFGEKTDSEIDIKAPTQDDSETVDNNDTQVNDSLNATSSLLNTLFEADKKLDADEHIKTYVIKPVYETETSSDKSKDGSENDNFIINIKFISKDPDTDKITDIGTKTILYKDLEKLEYPSTEYVQKLNINIKQDKWRPNKVKLINDIKLYIEKTKSTKNINDSTIDIYKFFNLITEDSDNKAGDTTDNSKTTETDTQQKTNKDYEVPSYIKKIGDDEIECTVEIISEKRIYNIDLKFFHNIPKTQNDDKNDLLFDKEPIKFSGNDGLIFKSEKSEDGKIKLVPNQDIEYPETPKFDSTDIRFKNAINGHWTIPEKDILATIEKKISENPNSNTIKVDIDYTYEKKPVSKKTGFIYFLIPIKELGFTKNSQQSKGSDN